MMRGLFMLLSCVAATLAAADNPFVVTMTPTGDFTVQLDGWSDFILQSGGVGVQINRFWNSPANGLLTLNGPVGAVSGSDSLGPYNATVTVWKTVGSQMNVMYAMIKQYQNVPAIVFEQYIPTDIQTGGTYADKDGVTTAFPSFQLPQTSAGAATIGWMQYSGPFLNNGIFGPAFGQWAAGTKFETGLGSGPIVLFNNLGNQAVVISSFTNFMAANAAQDYAGSLQHGFLGSIPVIPAGTSLSTVLWYGKGPNNAMMMWGAGLLQRYGKSRQGPWFDYTNSYLGYNTDHGAYYYYTTAQYDNYLDALLAVYDYAQAEGIPYKHVLLDSWWYYKGVGNGVLNWTAMPTIFPGGNDGMRNLTATTGWKVIAHNRYWSANTNYAIQNGGSWNFSVDSPSSPAGGQMAVPLDQSFWEYLLTDSAKSWGLTTYEQDWLYNELEGVDVLTADPLTAQQWLLQMDAGAQAAGVTIQMCMPFPKHVLQSVQMSKVTQARVSDDHVPGLFSIDVALQWRIGYSSLFAWSLGLAPFKDNYYSRRGQPGGSVGNANETSPALQEAISVFSAGPVTPGDGVGFSDATLILRSCNAGGLLLKPSRAATAIDAQIAARVFPGSGPSGEVYATYSLIAGYLWDHVVAASLNASFPLVPAALNSIRADAALITDEPIPLIGNADTLAYSLNATTFNLSTLVVAPFSANQPIYLLVCGEMDFQVWHTAPIFANTVAFLGELSKFMPVSPQRITDIQLMGPDVIVNIVGEAGESVELFFWSSGEVVAIQCKLDAAGRAQAAMPSRTC